MPHENSEMQTDSISVNSIKCVNSQSAVLLHFDLLLEDGSVAESTQSHGKPMLFRLGDGSLSPELEGELINLAIGDKKQFTLPPAAAFGTQNPNLVQYFSPNDFSQTGVPDIGAIMMFNAPNGSQLAGLIRDITADSVTVDFNHPLAGKQVTFKIEVIDIDPQAPVTEESSR